jgi:hypothetical protein
LSVASCQLPVKDLRLTPTSFNQTPGLLSFVQLPCHRRNQLHGRSVPAGHAGTGLKLDALHQPSPDKRKSFRLPHWQLTTGN